MNKTIFQILLIICFIIILVGSIIPNRPNANPNIWSHDKYFHIIAYFIFAFLAINSFKLRSFKSAIILIFIGTLFGGLIEIWQFAGVNRDADIYDIMANGLGMLLGCIITFKYLLLSK